MREYSLKRIEDENVWDALLEKSSQGNIFLYSKLLTVIFDECHFYILESEGVIHAGAAVVIENGEVVLAPHPYCPYVSAVIYNDNENDATHSSVPYELDIAGALINELSKRYNRISFGMHYSYSDIRAFQWFNYDKERDQRFDIDVRYTGILDLEKIVDWGEYIKGIRKNRHRDLKSSIKKGYVLDTGNYIEELIDIDIDNFTRQNIIKERYDIIRVENIAKSAIENNFGEILVAKDTIGKVVSAGLFLYYKNTCYYLAGATVLQHRNDGCGTLVMLEAINRARQRGNKLFDFVGVNSPARGDFKISFNASVVPYYLVTWVPNWE